jgi:hypothetical protein
LWSKSHLHPNSNVAVRRRRGRHLLGRQALEARSVDPAPFGAGQGDAASLCQAAAPSDILCAVRIRTSARSSWCKRGGKPARAHHRAWAAKCALGQQRGRPATLRSPAHGARQVTRPAGGGSRQRASAATLGHDARWCWHRGTARGTPLPPRCTRGA